jgi:entericidin B
MDLLKKFFASVLVLMALVALPACNTVEGMGEDIEGAGDAIEDAAD